ncbi:hypothetical protein [Salegentibacter maritimus]|uniref:hypothetical protein n=1 Tax=Salegentibacter maritimus TaxID=2794347 RepID=UPI0018E425CB|nr:hypothetical protein [Salegentibacter maritimus]MBI6115998.1 hypothetical protein [Salegentibacter maritimus]
MTAQAREIIYINGNKEQMATEPLKPFLKKHPHLRFEPPNTACWRGYFGTWELENDKLYLIDFEGDLEDLDGNIATRNLKDLFPGQKKVFADWFTGLIKIEMGKLLEYVHMGYASKYEQDLFLVFEDGVKVDEYLINNK